MASLCSAFSQLRVAPKGLASRCNGIAAAPKPLLAAVAVRPAIVDTAIVAKAKLKTRKAAAKRYKVTGSGKVMCRHAGKQHLNEKMNKQQKKRLSNEQAVFAGDVKVNVRKALPYAKISLRNCRVANKDHD